jgi:hypothetical protein
MYEHDRWRTISSAVKKWASRDSAAVIEWTQAQEVARYQEAGLQAAGAAWAETDAAAAAEFALSAGAELQAIPELAETIGTNFLPQDPVAGLDWVDQLVPGVRAPNEAHLFRELFHQNRQLAVSEFNARIDRLSVPAVERFSGEYFMADVEAARRWIEGLPPGLAYDSACAGIELAAGESGDGTLSQLARELGAR